MGKGSLFSWLRPKPRLTFEQFGKRVLLRLREDWPAETLDAGEDGQLIWGKGCGEPGFINLDRFYAHYLHHPRNLDDVLGWISAGLRPPPKATAETLLALVRPETFDVDEGRGIARPIAGILVGLPAVDTPESHAFAAAKVLREELGLSDGEIWSRALANTWEQIEPRPPELEPGEIVQILNELRLAPSLLLHDAMWDDRSVAAKGDLMVAPVERNELLIAYWNPELEADMRAMIASRGDDPEWLCDLILVRRDGGWQVLPDTGDAGVLRGSQH